MRLTRRTALTLPLAALGPRTARAALREITWDDLVPPGVPQSEIVGPGYIDEANDIWRPEYDANATRFNTGLDGAMVRLPGYVIPMDTAAEGTRTFVLVPYVGACIHTPPPPANQLVLVTSDRPWPIEDLWTPIWAEGRMTIEQQTTALAEVGYRLTADTIEVYEWD